MLVVLMIALQRINFAACLVVIHFLVDFTNLFAYKVCKPAPGKRPKEDQNGQESKIQKGCETGEGGEVAVTFDWLDSAGTRIKTQFKKGCAASCCAVLFC